ncbi:hypothetical protein NEOLEDRAFT_1071025 [Neolentinus lepideus HHB14362 ss-1]|uniref:DUF6533 domain-containing protein n=1 Tax=Neolentinus lepideus HHB14362 ss-1 TaxID=1314782 RepID=A0A165QM91_9AGAM|nr:hypothetical protein NEOLEDRAFT_1071025 [Neolentinus lepideus HHB14362 ss-1]
MPSELSAEVVSLISFLEGFESAKYLAVAMFAMSMYEYALTLEKEIKYFWSGSWSISRVLFLVSRYVPLIVIMCVSSHTLLTMLTLRVWYLCRFNVHARFLVVFTSVSCNIAAFAILGVIYKDLNAVSFSIPGLELNGCFVPAPVRLWRLLVPALVLHTLLYVFTTAPAVLRRNVYGKTNIVLDKLLRDGGFLYLAVLSELSQGFFTKSSTDISLPAIYSNMMPAIVSVCMSRVMFSIHSLAEDLNCNPDWLLSHLELSRVNWRKGENDRELIVEVIEDPEAIRDYELGVEATREGFSPLTTVVENVMTLDDKMVS